MCGRAGRITRAGGEGRGGEGRGREGKGREGKGREGFECRDADPGQTILLLCFIFHT